jgi:intracellular multiplication protein IcmG
MAWISEKGSDEIKTISVGDTVSGIGKVTAIAKDDGGRWVVNGTQGKINQ